MATAFTSGVQKDNGDLLQKVLLRTREVGAIRAQTGSDPVVCETHGGWGELWRRCYGDLPTGLVLDKAPEKARHLARQRRSWVVYCADSTKAIEAGVGGQLAVTLLDVDAYGDPWPVLEAWFTSSRVRAATLSVIVTDGVMMVTRMKGGSWRIGSQRDVVEQYGNLVSGEQYLRICGDRLARIGQSCGYTLEQFGGQRCGHGGQMTHYVGRLRRVEQGVV